MGSSPLRRAGKKLVIVGLIAALALGGTVVAVNRYINGKFAKTHDPTITAIDPLPPGRAYNILVLGSDRRDVVDPSLRTERQFRGGAGRRADTILVIHVAADQRSAVLLSFPRDLRVRIPGRAGYSRINAAYQGGPNLMIRTIRQYTGLRIHHYVEVNFAAFQTIVDAVGGLRLCVNRTYDDRESGLIIRKPGCQIFQGKLALAYVRMRKQDPKGDFGRIQRQQQFLRVLMRKVTSVGLLTHFPRLFRLADAVSKGVVTDKNLELGEVKGIANKLAGFRQSRVDFRVVPSFPKYIGRVAYVVERTSEARALFAALRSGRPLPPYGKTGESIPQPGDVTVTVLNGTPKSELAGKVARELKAAGFKVRRTVRNADRRDYATTTILFQPGGEAKAQLLQDELPGSVAEEATDPIATDLVVIVGADAEGG